MSVIKKRMIRCFILPLIFGILFIACPPITTPTITVPAIDNSEILEKMVFSTNDALDYITKTFTLPLEIKECSFVWSSDSPNLIIGGDGKATIIRSEKTDISGTLTAIIEYKGARAFRKFDFTIKKKGVIELMDQIQFTPPDTRTTVTKDFTVKLTVSEAGTDYTLEWSSNNTTVLSFAGAVGKITRPDWNQDNTTVKITVKITSAGKTTNENFNIIILSKDAPTVTMEKNVFRKVFEDDLESYSNVDEFFAKKDKDGKHRYTLTYYQWHFYKNGVRIKDNVYGRSGRILTFNERKFDQSTAEDPAIVGTFNEDYSYMGIPPYSTARWENCSDGSKGAKPYDGVLNGGIKMGKKILYGYIECEVYLPPRQWGGPWAGFWFIGTATNQNEKCGAHNEPKNIAGFEPDFEFLSNNKMWIQTHLVSEGHNKYFINKMKHAPSGETTTNIDLASRGCMTGNLHGQWIKFALLWTPHLYQLRIGDKPFISIVDDKMWFEQQDNPNWATDGLTGKALDIWNKLLSFNDSPFGMQGGNTQRTVIRNINKEACSASNARYNVVPNIPLEVIWSCNNNSSDNGEVDPGQTNKGKFRTAPIGTEWDHFAIDNIKYYEWIGIEE